jgi:hypothetical protein
MNSARLGVRDVCLLAVVVLSAVVPASGADTTLRWKFAAGQKLNYNLNQKMAMKMDVAGKKVETTFTQNTDLTWEVKGVDKDGNADMVQTIDRIRFELAAPGSNVLLDTANAQDAPGTPEVMSKVFRSMANCPFSMKVTPRGEFRDFSIPPKLVEAFKSAGPGGAMFANEESLKNLCGQSVLVFPEAAVAQGKSWKGARKLPMPFGTMGLDMNYTLDGATGPIQNIGIDVKVDIEPKEGSPVDVKVTSQEMKGHYFFDNSAGVLKSTDVAQKLSLALTVGGNEIAQDLQSTVKMELKDRAAAK